MSRRAWQALLPWITVAVVAALLLFAVIVGARVARGQVPSLPIGRVFRATVGTNDVLRFAVGADTFWVRNESFFGPRAPSPAFTCAYGERNPMVPVLLDSARVRVGFNALTVGAYILRPGEDVKGPWIKAVEFISLYAMEGRQCYVNTGVVVVAFRVHAPQRRL